MMFTPKNESRTSRNCLFEDGTRLELKVKVVDGRARVHGALNAEGLAGNHLGAHPVALHRRNISRQQLLRGARVCHSESTKE